MRKKPFGLSKIAGIFLIVFAIIGYLTIADDLRHKGELFGVTCVLLAGIMLLINSVKVKFISNLALHWISICLLACIPIGSYVLDNMILAMIIALILGLGLAYFFRKQNSHPQDNIQPDPK
jgi:cbb3-type cytochrome oxidase subunit 3